MAIPVMRSASNLPIIPQGQGSKDAIYVAAVPLRAANGPAQLLMSATYSLNLWDLQHYMVLIRPTSPLHSQAFAFDFQPQDPENMSVALAVLSGRRVPGVVLVRKLTKLPKKKCWFVGFSQVDAVDITKRFNECWQTDLKVGQHDCRNYTNGLVEYLTGEKYVLERLRKGHRFGVPFFLGVLYGTQDFSDTVLPLRSRTSDIS